MARNLGIKPIALAADIQLRDDGKAPTEIRILRAGLNETDRGYPILFDDVAAAMVMEAFRVDGKPRLYADWNHGMLPSEDGTPPTRESGASSCSFVPEIRDGELWAADIEWTAKGRADVEGREYNLFSPAFPPWTDEEGNVRPKKLINFALVNLAGLRNIEPLLAASADVLGTKETTMTAEEITRLTARNTELETENKTLRLAATEVASLTGVLALGGSAGATERADTVRGLVTLRAEVLRATGETTNEGAVAALRSIKDQAAKATALEAQIEADRATALRAELDVVWALAAKEGKLPPGEIKEEEESLTQFTGGKVTRAVVDAARRRVEKLGARVVRAGEGERGNGTDAVIALTASEKELAKRGNVSEAAMLKAKQDLADQDAKRAGGRAS